ncbi:VirB4 family type IV secretion system protein [Streptodolium elevatio]
MKPRRSDTRHEPFGTAGAFAPDSLVVGPRHVEVGGEWVASFAVTGYPREVHPGWLQPLLTYPGRVDVSLHIEPIDPATAAHRLKKQLAKLESGRRHTYERGQLLDPQVEAATEDAYDLSSRVARGEGKLYRLGLYLTVRAATEEALADEVGAVRALAASLLMDCKPTTYRSLQGWITCLPMGLDLVRMRRTFDTSALASAFPFTSPDLAPPDPASATAPSGVLYGYNLGSQGLVHWDRFALDNHNSAVLGRSGAGKSYLVKLELLRSLYRGVHAHVIDPEDEYTRLAAAVGGAHVSLGAEGVRLNPFDLPIQTGPDGRRLATRDALVRRSLFLHTFLAVLLGEPPDPAERAALDEAITATYRHAGITNDPRTWKRPAPQLADLATTLDNARSPVSESLAARLHPFVHGTFADLFDGPTTTHPDSHLVVFSLRDLADELKSVGTLLVLDTIWRQVSNPRARRPRLVVVDEAWLLMQQTAGADFLFRMAKASRKHWAGLTVATQDTADVLATNLGRAVIANAATQILLRQATQAIDEVTHVFDLSDGERQFLLSADRGQGLLSTGTQRVAFHAIASPAEHALVTSDPAELSAYAGPPYEVNGGAYVDFDDLGPLHDDLGDDPDEHIDLGAA